MKKFTLIALITLIGLLLLQSCTMEKRVYRKGYHVTWNSKVPAAEPQAAESGKIVPIENKLVPIEAIDEAPTLIAGRDEEQKFLLENSIIGVPAPQQPVMNNIKDSAATDVVKDIVKKRIPSLALSSKKFAVPAPDQSADVRPHWMSVVSLVAGILSLFAYYGAIPLSILAVIFGFIALRRINENPGTYRGRGLAIAGIICGLVALVIITTVLIVAVI